jgi:2-oxoacid:acceptor oxidoreductase gamma subunit (pyruvate/2-ketoisovalerate family)
VGGWLEAVRPAVQSGGRNGQDFLAAAGKEEVVFVLGIRIHGRGGQGAVVASKILAKAYFIEGFQVQAFPAFGMERRGAPVAAYVRVDDKPTLARGEIQAPQTAIVLDPVLLEMVDVNKGLPSDGLLILNHPDEARAARTPGPGSLAVVDAARIALKHGLGSRLAPIVNTIILGAYARAAHQRPLDLESLLQAITETVPAKKEANARAAVKAFQQAYILERD